MNKTKKNIILFIILLIFMLSIVFIYNKINKVDNENIEDIKEDNIVNIELEDADEEREVSNKFTDIVKKNLNKGDYTKLPKFVILDESPGSPKVVERLKQGEFFKLYGVEWKYNDLMNELKEISNVRLSYNYSKKDKSKEDILKVFDDITTEVLENNSRIIYAKNTNIDILRDNEKLKRYFKYIKDNEDNKVDQYSFDKEIEKNTMYIVFEGKDFYMMYYVYNNEFLEEINYSIVYFSKNTSYMSKPNFENGKIIDDQFNILENVLIESKGKSDLPKMYKEYDGSIIEYKDDVDLTEEETDIMNFLMIPVDEDKFKEHEEERGTYEYEKEEINNHDINLDDVIKNR